MLIHIYAVCLHIYHIYHVDAMHTITHVKKACVYHGSGWLPDALYGHFLSRLAGAHCLPSLCDFPEISIQHVQLPGKQQNIQLLCKGRLSPMRREGPGMGKVTALAQRSKEGCSRRRVGECGSHPRCLSWEPPLAFIWPITAWALTLAATQS